MVEKPEKPAGKAKLAARRKRSARALRENLKRRKAQARSQRVPRKG
jgi:hypothetical protein